MSKTDGGNSVPTTQPIALVELGAKIGGLVRAGTLDTRCAAKLLSRLDKEADEVIKADAASEDTIKAALKDLKRAIRDADASGFVKASAALRRQTLKPPAHDMSPPPDPTPTRDVV